MSVSLSKDICQNLAAAEAREWLITNGIGGYASGTVAGLLTRRYHGLLIAALAPPHQKTLLLSKINETVTVNQVDYDLYSDRYLDQSVFPQGYKHLERFFLVGTTPVWEYRLGDAVLEKRIWMEQGENTTYIKYFYKSGKQPLQLTLEMLVNYREDQQNDASNLKKMLVSKVAKGLKIKAHNEAPELYLLGSTNGLELPHWHGDYCWSNTHHLAIEHRRGQHSQDAHLQAGVCNVGLLPGTEITIIATTETVANLKIEQAWKNQYQREQELLTKVWRARPQQLLRQESSPPWIDQLILAANQFICTIPFLSQTPQYFLMRGIPWSGDSRRHEILSLPGLTLATGRPLIARSIIRNFGAQLAQKQSGVFSESASSYHALEAILGYFDIVYAYFQQTKDKGLIQEVFPILSQIVTSYYQGNQYSVFQDQDGLLFIRDSPTKSSQSNGADLLMLMRQGKPIEINALWYNALLIMHEFAQAIGESAANYREWAEKVNQGFQRYWIEQLGYCYDILDTDDGNDNLLRPYQLMALSLPSVPASPPLLTEKQQKSLLEIVMTELLTSYGLKSLPAKHPDFMGEYSGDSLNRNSLYHQGAIWPWLLGSLVKAHLKVYGQPDVTKNLLLPMAAHLQDAGLGSISEIFEGFSPMLQEAVALTVVALLKCSTAGI